MISIVISFYRPNLLNQLIENIKVTIGVEHEIIAIENKSGQSISKIYNKGITKANFNTICFIHEDLLIETSDWGFKINEIFAQNPDIGLIGIAGNKRKTKAPSQTWDLSKEYQVINIRHTIDNKSEHICYGWKNKKLQEVIIVDGVFLCIQKDQNLNFNSQIPGFHFYDMSISLECKIKGLKTAVTKEIMINHFSKGNIDSSWIYSAHIFHKIYSRHLPMSLSELATEEEEKKKLAGYVIFCVEQKFIRISLIYWFKHFVLYPFSGFSLLYLKYLIRNVF